MVEKSRFSWIPCSGFRSKNIEVEFPAEHVGEVRLDGKPTGKWLPFEEAEAKHHGISKKTSHALCPTCEEIWSEF